MMKIMVVLWASLVAACAANAPLAPECRWLLDHPRAAIDLRDRGELRHLSDDALRLKARSGDSYRTTSLTALEIRPGSSFRSCH